MSVNGWIDYLREGLLTGNGILSGCWPRRAAPVSLGYREDAQFEARCAKTHDSRQRLECLRPLLFLARRVT